MKAPTIDLDDHRRPQQQIDPGHEAAPLVTHDVLTNRGGQPARAQHLHGPGLEIALGGRHPGTPTLQNLVEHSQAGPLRGQGPNQGEEIGFGHRTHAERRLQCQLH